MNTISPWRDATTIRPGENVKKEARLKVLESLRAFVEVQVQKVIDQGAPQEEIGLEFRFEAVYVRVHDQTVARFSLNVYDSPEFDKDIDHRCLSGYF